MDSDPNQPHETDTSSEAVLHDGFNSYGDIAEKLGRFDPPADFDHGEEFADEPPRTIPKHLWKGSYAQRRRGHVRTLIVLGIGCIVFWPMPFVQTLSFYILPLAYLHWGGLALILFGVIGFFRNLLPTGHFKYVTHGSPHIGRVLTPAIQPAGTPEYPSVALAAGIEYQHPDTGRQIIATFATTESWSDSAITHYSQTIQPGDYVTLVSLPDNFETSLRLYGYLGLDPDREFILKDGHPVKAMSASAAVLIAVAILGGIGVFLAGMHVVLTSIPSGGEPWKFIGGGIAGLVAALMAWAVVRYRQRKAGVEPTGETLGPIISGILGAIAGLIAVCLINSQFDDSEGVYDSVEVVNFWEKTHNFVFRTYEIEYREPGAGGTNQYQATIDDINRLSGSEMGFVSDLAVMDYAEGTLGLEWIRGIYPIVWVDADSVEERSDVDVTLEVPVEDEVVESKLTPVILIDETTIVTPDEDLAQRALIRLKQDPLFGFKIIPDEAGAN